MSENRYIIVEQQKEMTCITLNRPEKRNALNMALLEQLCKVIQETTKNPYQKVLILTGQGSAFCSGMDLREAVDHSTITPLSNLIAKALVSLYNCPLVTIAAVNGPAIAGGAGLMSACDFAIAASDVKMGFPEIKHGLVAAQVATLLTRQIAWRHVRELLLLGELIDARRALDIGLVSHVVPPDELMSQALKLAHQAMKNPPEAITETKRLLSMLEPHAFPDDLRIAIQIHRKARRSHIANKGIASFLAKKSEKHPKNT